MTEILIAVSITASIFEILFQRRQIRKLKREVSDLLVASGRAVARLNDRCDALAVGLRDLSGTYVDPNLKPPSGYEDEDMDVEDNMTHFRVPDKYENDGSGE